MNFTGTGKRLKQGEIGELARGAGISTAVLLTVLEVEARGRGFDSKNRPIILFEPHIFYRQLGKGSKRNKAVAAGLAYRKWGASKYPWTADARYEQLERARRIDIVAGMNSASYGLPQIMGFNHKDAGFISAELMVKTMMQGEREQVIAMITLIKSWGILGSLRGKDFTKSSSWRPFSERWNGKSYAKHGYHTKLARVFRKHSSGGGTVVNSSILRQGMRGEAVRALQADLKSIGFMNSPVDGRYGPDTKIAIILFQEHHNLIADGIAGPKTLAAIKLAVSNQGDAEKSGGPTTSPDIKGFWRILLEAIAKVFSK